eukprot:NODE_1774_length_1387_cov_37.508730_g1684_i0.p1 GENE.NODE_1774_length_1387_cov_37.508730_g1684_i0~~NODE_1774_length_1387_cov_37.508730_g1684_i0.p1  ORF type:complete len:422 (-),score=91.40 NODE_1774_length_1387_cov_37.508730_g1684_i0:73-1338(-)
MSETQGFIAELLKKHAEREQSAAKILARLAEWRQRKQDNVSTQSSYSDSVADSKAVPIGAETLNEWCGAPPTSSVISSTSCSSVSDLYPKPPSDGDDERSESTSRLRPSCSLCEVPDCEWVCEDCNHLAFCLPCCRTLHQHSRFLHHRLVGTEGRIRVADLPPALSASLKNPAEQDALISGMMDLHKAKFNLSEALVSLDALALTLPQHQQHSVEGLERQIGFLHQLLDERKAQLTHHIGTTHTAKWDALRATRKEVEKLVQHINTVIADPRPGDPPLATLHQTLSEGAAVQGRAQIVTQHMPPLELNMDGLVRQIREFDFTPPTSDDQDRSSKCSSQFCSSYSSPPARARSLTPKHTTERRGRRLEDRVLRTCTNEQQPKQGSFSKSKLAARDHSVASGPGAYNRTSPYHSSFAMKKRPS